MSVWLKEPRPSRDRRISRELMTRRAIEILDAGGLDALSMRRLAAEFGATVGSLYWYVATKDELLELALDEVLGEVRPEATAGQGGTWREALAGYARAQRAMLLRHRWALTVMGRVPNVGPNALALTEQVLGLLRRAGVPSVTDALAAVNDQVTGSVLAQISWEAVVAATGAAPDGWRGYVERIAGDHPLLAAQLAAGTGHQAAPASPAAVSERRFEFALGCLLDGLATAAGT